MEPNTKQITKAWCKKLTDKNNEIEDLRDQLVYSNNELGTIGLDLLKDMKLSPRLWNCIMDKDRWVLVELSTLKKEE